MIDIILIILIALAVIYATIKTYQQKGKCHSGCDHCTVTGCVKKHNK